MSLFPISLRSKSTCGESGGDRSLVVVVALARLFPQGFFLPTLAPPCQVCVRRDLLLVVPWLG